MSIAHQKTIEDLFTEGQQIDEALRQAVQEALLRHKQAGNPIAAWQDGKLVWIRPEDIPVGKGHN